VFIPINETVEDPRQVMPYENILKIVDKARYFTKTACPCKYQYNQDAGHDNCKNDLHVCLHFDRLGEYIVQNNIGTEITKEEMLEILKQSADAGMVHGVSISKEGVDTVYGVCVHKCPKDALYLIHREGEQDYPEDPRETATRMLSERGHNPMESFKNNYWR